MHLIKKALIILTDSDSLASISDAFSGNLSQGNNWTRLFSYIKLAALVLKPIFLQINQQKKRKKFLISR
jgi:hypothetical protein